MVATCAEPVVDILAAPHGFEPRSTESKSAVLPLDEGAMVGAEGNDPSTPVLSGLCSTSELCASRMVGEDGFEPTSPEGNGFTVRRSPPSLQLTQIVPR